MKKKIIRTGLGIFGLCFFIVVVWITLLLINLPDVSVLKHYRPSAATEVLDKDGNLLTQYYERKFRIWAPIESLPDVVIRAVVIAEDDTFFGHEGINYRATWDALVHDVRKGRYARGGSTITQQMIKNVMLSREKTLGRKLREYVLAKKAEDLLTKRRILEIYLNEVEWGDNLYGIEAASRFYFDKHATELSPAEAALLAGMLPNPRYYNPYKRMDKARDRQERVLFNMFQAKLLSEEEYTSSLAATIRLRGESSGRFDFSAMNNANGRPCYQHVLEGILISFYGESDVYRRGLRIRTTLDKSLQERSFNTEGAEHGKPNDYSGRLIVIRQDGKVRSLVCAANEADVRKGMKAFGLSGTYELETMDPSLITKDDILLPGAEGTN